MTLQAFMNIDDRMLWKGAALAQIEAFEALAVRLGCDGVCMPKMSTPGHHTSKSIRLPVVELCLPGFRFLLRNNFHDIEMCVQAGMPVTMTRSALFDGVLQPRNWAWYLAEIARCRGYSWKFWTDEQMDDPNICRVVAIRHDCGGIEQEWTVEPGEKARWLKRMTSPEWYSRDWSSGSITSDEPFGPGATFWVQHRLFGQGIAELVPPEDLHRYAPGVSGFGVSVGTIEQAATIIRRLIEPPAKSGAWYWSPNDQTWYRASDPRSPIRIRSGVTQPEPLKPAEGSGCDPAEVE